VTCPRVVSLLPCALPAPAAGMMCCLVHLTMSVSHGVLHGAPHSGCPPVARAVCALQDADFIQTDLPNCSGCKGACRERGAPSFPPPPPPLCNCQPHAIEALPIECPNFRAPTHPGKLA
jgi:hypothetical protein